MSSLQENWRTRRPRKGGGKSEEVVQTIYIHVNVKKTK
jgi:hypothetical protein